MNISRTARLTSFVVLAAVTAILLVLFYRVVSALLLPLFLASVVVLLFRPVYMILLKCCRGRRYTAAALMTASVLLAVLIPCAAGFLLAGIEAAQLSVRMDETVFRDRLNAMRSRFGLDYPFQAECRFIESSLHRLREDAARGTSAGGNLDAVALLAKEFGQLHSQVAGQRLPLTVPDPQPLQQALTAAAAEHPGTLAWHQSVEAAELGFRTYKVALLGGVRTLWLKELINPSAAEIRGWTEQLFVVSPGRLASFGSRTGSVIARTAMGILVFVFAMFFWFADGPRIMRTLMQLSPLDDRYEEQLLAEFEVLVRAVVAGSIASALAQTILAGIGFWFVGMQSVFLLMALTALLAMVPFVGPTLVWMPVCAWLVFGEGRLGAGIGLAVYCAAIVSTIDNVIRPWILLERTALHPLAALIGVFGGVQALGPTGVFVGPIVVAFLQSVLLLLHREFAEMDGDENNSQTDSPAHEPNSTANATLATGPTASAASKSTH